MKSIDVFCVFTEAVESTLRVGVVGRAIERGVVALRTFDLRDFAPKGRIDDMPFGGGAGMVVRVDVVARAFEEVYGIPARKVREERRVLVTEPGGRYVEQEYVRELAEEVSGGRGLTIVCGRYGGSESLVGESFSREGSIGPPQYTRPAAWDGEDVPAVLLSGNHAEIQAWREREARERAEARAERRNEAEEGPRFVSGAPDNTHERRQI
ncbi:MAG: hypothetical protein LC781_05435 [Actinobacteria bacterium]|nr:hypothetical protein [Actinomycetota bacterium]